MWRPERDAKVVGEDARTDASVAAQPALRAAQPPPMTVLRLARPTVKAERGARVDVLLRAAAPHPATDQRLALSLLPNMLDDSDSDDALAMPACTHESAIVPPSFYDEIVHSVVSGAGAAAPAGGVDDGAVLTPLATLSLPRPAPSATSGVAGAAQNDDVKDGDEDGGGGDGAPSIYIHRVSAMPALPLPVPLAPGTNLNLPTANYLQLDAQYNLHQHAPGFRRRGSVAALQSLLTSALHDPAAASSEVTVLSSGPAMHAVFEHSYAEKESLMLLVRRVGPILAIDAHDEAATSVAALRQKALLSKTLYRHAQQLNDAAAGEPGGCVCLAAGPQAGAPPPPRVHAALTAQSRARYERYSQVLRLDTGRRLVFVGVDAPLVRGGGAEGAEQLLRLERVDADGGRDTAGLLATWFDATLLHVPQVGVYHHRAGMVERYEVRKVRQLLTAAEQTGANAALHFLSEVLEWLVRHCVKEPGSYVVVGGHDSDYLELYELPDAVSAAASEFCHDPASAAEEEEEEEEARAAQRRRENTELNLSLARMCYGMARHMLSASPPAHAAAASVRGGDNPSPGGRDATRMAHDAHVLLLRSFMVFMQCAADGPQWHDTVHDILRILPLLFRRWIGAAPDPCAARTPAPRRRPRKKAKGGRDTTSMGGDDDGEEDGGGAGAGEAAAAAHTSSMRAALRSHEDAVAMLRRMQDRLCLALRQDSEAGVFTRLVLSLLQDCATAWACLGACMLNAASCFALPAAAGETEKDEGSAGEAAERTRVWGAVLRTVRGDLRAMEEVVQSVLEQPQPQPHTAARSEAAPPASTAPSAEAPRSLVDPRTEIDLGRLRAVLHELYGDLTLSLLQGLVASETPGATAADTTALLEALRAPQEAARPAGGDAAPDATAREWGRALTAEPVGISFVALRYYAKAMTWHAGRGAGAAETIARLHRKTAQVHYRLAGDFYRAERYTKALEALGQARQILRETCGTCAATATPGSADGGGCAVVCSLQMRHVVQALGDVYAGLAAMKARLATAAAAAASAAAPHDVPQLTTAQQPLTIGLCHRLGEEETRFMQSALDAYKEAGCQAARVHLLLRYAALLLESTTAAGVAADRATAARIYFHLQEAEKGCRADRAVALAGAARTREWQLLRLFTAAAANTLPHELDATVEALTERWCVELDGGAVREVRRTVDGGGGGAAGAGEPPRTEARNDAAQPRPAFSPLTASLSNAWRDEVSAVEQHLQLALVCAVFAERRAHTLAAGKGSQGHSRRSLAYECQQWARKAVAFLGAAAAAALEPGRCAEERLRLIAAVWRCGTPAGWLYRMSSMIAARVLRAGGRALTGKPHDTAAALFAQVLKIEGSGNAADDGAEQKLTRLLDVLQPLLAW